LYARDHKADDDYCDPACFEHFARRHFNVSLSECGI
jgi:hypothetical protein